MLLKILQKYLIIGIFFLISLPYVNYASDIIDKDHFFSTISSHPSSDSLFSDTLNAGIDTLQKPDSVASVRQSQDTSLKQPSKEKTFLEDKVVYKAKDSIINVLAENKILLFGEAQINYQDIELKADYIEFNMTDNEVFARGVEDSTGNVTGTPVFKEGGKTFNAKKMTYNFKTKKGVIKHVFTEEEGGYLHGKKIKRHPNQHIHMKFGKYTTCSNKEHPHFYIAMTKAEVIPNDKIIAGPSYLVIEDVPLYFIGLPFGFFPNTNRSSSGVIIPKYGEESRRGFFLREGGYYFTINDYMDLTLTGDIYSNGTWGIGMRSNYVKRYKYRGNVDADYHVEATGEKFDDVSDTYEGNFSLKKDISFQWYHSQDNKAHPFRRFNANVDFSSTTYDKRYSYNAQNYLRNTKRSNISYHRTWPDSPFDFSANLRHSQNSQTRKMNLKLPELALNMRRVFPFRSDNTNGDGKWYEDIGFSYSAEITNDVNTTDTTLFETPEKAFARRNLKNGFKHNIPLSINFKPLKLVNISPQISYHGVLYDRYIHKYNSNYDETTDSAYFHSITDTIYGFRYGHTIKPSVSTSFTPKLYGMYQFRNPNAKVSAIRHVMSTSLSFGYTPDISGFLPDYYRKIAADSLGTSYTKYSVFQNGIYGTPSVTQQESGSIGLSIRNNIEAKIRNKNDTANEFNKIKILDHLDFRTSYNVFADSLNLSNIRFTGGTRLLNDNIDLTFGGTFDPYVHVLNEKGNAVRVNQFLINSDNKKLVRLTQFTTSLSTRINNSTFNKTENKDEKSKKNNQNTSGGQEKNVYDYFNVKWSLYINYNITMTRPHEFKKKDVIQTFGFGGNLNLTDKWKIGFSSGFDLEIYQLTHTNMNIYRDLHCWEMRLSLSPFGNRKFYTFTINVKSAVLQDLKYEKKKPLDFY